MKVLFGGDISFDWLSTPSGLGKLLSLGRLEGLGGPIADRLHAERNPSWLQRRLRLSEVAHHTRNLKRTLGPVASRANHFCANLESVLARGGDKVDDKQYTLKASPLYALMLKAVGITHVNLANNHILDYGPVALDECCRSLEQAGIGYGGLSRAGGPQEPMMLSGETQVAVLNYLEPGLIDPSPDVFFDHDPCPAALDPERVCADINSAKGRNPVVVVLHWGEEWCSMESAAQQNMARSFIDAGACAVIGHHTHVAGAVEEYRDGLICYGLGNLMMVLPRFSAERGNERPMVELEFNRNGLHGYELIPLETAEQPYPAVSRHFKVETLRTGFRPTGMPAPEETCLDSVENLADADVSFNGSEGSMAAHWDDNHLNPDHVMNRRFPVGRGWRIENTDWCGTGLMRECIAGEFRLVNASYFRSTGTISHRFRLSRPVARLILEYGYPAVFHWHPRFVPARIAVTVSGRELMPLGTVDDRAVWHRTEIDLEDLGREGGVVDVQLDCSPANYGLLLWRLVGTAPDSADREKTVD